MSRQQFKSLLEQFTSGELSPIDRCRLERACQDQRLQYLLVRYLRSGQLI